MDKFRLFIAIMVQTSHSFAEQEQATIVFIVTIIIIMILVFKAHRLLCVTDMAQPDHEQVVVVSVRLLVSISHTHASHYLPNAHNIKCVALLDDDEESSLTSPKANLHKRKTGS